MAIKSEKVQKAFEFFKKQRQKQKEFTLAEIQVATGWGESTVKTYQTKRWNSFLKKTSSGWIVTSCFDTFNQNSFIQHHSQTEQVKKFFYQLLVDKAVAASVSSIEIYNKPDFQFREESFSILMINAWELLLKAKILQENVDNIKKIQIIQDNKVKLSASGNPQTISITKALNLLESGGKIKKVVGDNIRLLIEIRDESVHFVHNDLVLAEKIQSIGTASIKNFMVLAMKWFEYDFRKYNFYLMPISFYHQSDMESFSIDKKSSSNLIQYLKNFENDYEDDEDPNFSISLKLETRFVKTSSDEAIQVRISDNLNAPEIQISEEDALKNYPYTYKKLCNLFKKRYKNFKQNNDFLKLMKTLKSQGEDFCKERKLDPKNPKSIYKTFYHNRIVEEFDKHYEKN